MNSLLLTIFTSIDSTATATQAATDMSMTQLISQTIDKVVGWGKTAFHYLPNFIVAVIILIIFYFIGRLLRKLMGRILRNMTDSHTVVDLVEAVVGALFVAIGLFLALAVIGLSGIVTTLLAGAGILGLVLGFALQDIASNFISGVILSIRQPFKKGDIIENQDYYGTVQKINLRCTLIRTTQGQIVYIPNSDVLDKPLTNYTQTNERRIDLDIGVSYAEDHEEAKRLAIEAVKTLDNYNKDRKVELFYTGIGGYTFNYTIRFWVKFRKNPDYLAARSDAVIAIGKIYEENNIDMPFPIQTLDFGPKGGEKLNDVLSNG